jgi:hypothetical protein
VIEDYGFVLTATWGTSRARCIVLCGILAFGTGIATQAVLDLKQIDKRAVKDIARSEPCLLVFRGRVSGFMIYDIQLVANTRLDPGA